MTYENLLREAEHHAIDIYEKPMKPTIKGLYGDKIIWINRDISTFAEKSCILAEELGHYHTSSGDIINQSDVINRKQENRARQWAFKRLVLLTKIVQAHREGIRNRYELAEFLNVTEGFLEESLKRYREIYGLFAQVDGYTICFEPLGVIELFD